MAVYRNDSCRIAKRGRNYGMGELTPSESEWLIMEIIWKKEESMTAAEIIKELKEVLPVTKTTVRVMINRLVAKEILTYTVDEKDSRVYHYTAVRSKEECLALKSERFVKNYFGGNASLAVANFLKSGDITREQLEELESLVAELIDK